MKAARAARAAWTELNQVNAHLLEAASDPAIDAAEAGRLLSLADRIHELAGEGRDMARELLPALSVDS